MVTLIGLQIRLIRKKIENIERRYFCLIFCVLILMAILLEVILYEMLNSHMKFMQDICMKYTIIGIIYMGIIFWPIEVYKTFIENKNFDILFMAPISLKSCFIWNYIKKIAPSLVVCIIMIMMLFPFMVDMKIKAINYFLLNIFIILTIYTGYILIEILMYIFIGDNLYKGIITIVGIEEIVSFFIVMKFFEGKVNWIKNIDFSKILYNKSLGMFLLWSVSLACMMIISYLTFEAAYYKRGRCNNISDNAILKCKFLDKINNFYYLSKDFKLFVRNMDRMKYLIVTYLIYFFSTFFNAKKVDASAVFIAILSFTVITIFQLSYENIFSEKKTYDVLVMAEISLSNFILQKVKFSVCISTAITTLYGICLVAKNNLEFVEILNISLILIPLVLFLSLIINESCSVILFELALEYNVLNHFKIILVNGTKMISKMGIILIVHSLLYFIKIQEIQKCVCEAILFFWIIHRYFNMLKRHMEENLILDM